MLIVIRSLYTVPMAFHFHEYEEKAHKTALYPNRGANLYYPALGLAGESGEVAEKVKKMIRDDNGTLTDIRRGEIGKELGDVLWYVAAICHELGISMEDVARNNIEKLSSRAQRGALHGEGDNR